MDAKEKAEHLVKRFRKLVDHDEASNYGFVYSHKIETINAKHCAVICAHEALDHYKVIRDSVCHMGKDIAYWKDVLEEINKIPNE